MADQGWQREIEAKVYAGERLSRADGEALYACDDLAWLGRLAHHRRTELNGDRVMFNVNRHLNLTNVCSASCAYCSFQRKPGEKAAYTMRVDEAVAKAKEMEDEQLTELHIVNGLHPTLPWKYYPRVLRELKAALPGVSLKCFTATEIQWFEKISGLPADEILDELIDAGLDSLTGGGAEIFDWEVRQHIVDHATHWEDWSRIHRHRAQQGPEDAGDHAVRAHRGAAAPGRPRAAPARAAGRDRRLRGLHPAALPARLRGLGRRQGPQPAAGPHHDGVAGRVAARRSRCPGCCGTTCRT